MVNRKLQLHFLLTLIVGVLILSFFILSPFLAPLTLAAVFTVVLHPLYKKILRKLGNHEAIASLVTVIISVICILLPISFLGTKIFYQAAQLYSSIMQGNNNENIIITVINSIGTTINSFIPGTANFFINLSNNLDVYIKQWLVWLINHLGVALSGISILLLHLFIFFVSLYYLLRDGPKLKRELIKLSPLDDNDDEIVFGRLENAVNSVIKGSLLISLIQGTLMGIGFTFFGIPNGILWGAVTFISALIPGIGTALVLIPGVIYLFISGHFFPALGLMLWGSLGVGLIDNMLGPKIIGNKLQLHPLLVLLSVLGGLAFFGPIGIFLGPLTISLLFAFISTYLYLVNRIEKQK